MKANEKNALGEAIRRRREEIGLTQDQLARKLGYKSRSTINKIEKGINDVTQTKIEQFAVALDTTPERLTGWDGLSRLYDDRSGIRFALAKETEELDESELGDVMDFIRFLKSKKSKN